MLSVLIVNWNTRDLLDACLDSLRRFPPDVPMDVHVLDNASQDDSAAMVRARHPDVDLVSSDRNLGYAAGNNRLAERAKREFILTLNPDAEVTEGALQAAIDALRSEPSGGSLGAKLVGTGGEVQQSVRGFPTVLGIVGDATGLGKLFPKSPFGSYRLPAFDYSRKQRCEQPMGTFLLLKREALTSVGDPSRPFDETFPIFFNEVDLLFRMRQAGWTCLYDPDVVILHRGGASTRQVRKSMIWESHLSLIRFFRKHRRAVWNAPLYLIVDLFILGAALVRARGIHAGFRA